MDWRKGTSKLIEGFKFVIGLLKVNKLSRLVIGLVLASVCLKLSEYKDFWIYPAILFAIYPVWLTFWLLIYAWIINPIRENLPNSWMAKKVIPFLDNMVDK